MFKLSADEILNISENNEGARIFDTRRKTSWEKKANGLFESSRAVQNSKHLLYQQFGATLLPFHTATGYGVDPTRFSVQ